MKIVLYILTHGFQPKLMANFYNVDVSIIRKYIELCMRLWQIRINFTRFIFTFIKQCLLFIIERFKDLIGI